MPNENSLTSTDILASASEALFRGGYRRVPDPVASQIGGNARVFEDPYCIVQMVVYETWAELESNWTDAQAVLVELISKYVNATEPKAWEGYLILLTPSVLPSKSFEEAIQIKNDFNRVRKLLATGEDLRTTLDVERLLLPFLPIFGEPVNGDQPSRVLELLPEILEKHGIEKGAADALIRAFLGHRPLLESLHQYLANA